MERYIGTKIVLAEPCPKDDRGLVDLTRPIEGELLQGYKVVYEDGYTSWSPKETFERAYRRITTAELDLLR